MKEKVVDQGQSGSRPPNERGDYYFAPSKVSSISRTRLFQLPLPPLLAMGLFASFLDKICEHCSTQSIYVLAVVGALSFISLSVVVNVLRQLLFKNPHEPPVVFHWFPFVGSTISYGIDPYKFFFGCREKVCPP